MKWTLIALLIANSYCHALSLVAERAPEISATEAIKQATEFLNEKEKRTEETYLCEAKLGYHYESNQRKWKIVFARTKTGYFFTLVDMEGKVSVAPKPKKKEFKLKPSEPKKDGVPWGRPANWEDQDI